MSIYFYAAYIVVYIVLWILAPWLLKWSKREEDE